MKLSYKSMVICFLCGFTYIFVFSFNTLIEYIDNGEFAFLGLATDDALYLTRPYEVAKGNNDFWVYAEKNSFKTPIKPSWVTDKTVGEIAIMLNIPPFLLGIVLDFIFAGMSFALACLILFQFSKSAFWVSVGAILMISGFLSVYVRDLFFIVLNISTLEFFIDSYKEWLRPGFRAVYTQVSFTHYLLCILLLIKNLFAEKYEGKIWFLMGCLSSLSLYMYFFSWVTICAFIVTTTCFYLSDLGHKKLLIILGSFLMGFILLSLPGLYIILGSQHNGALKHAIIGQFWSIPIVALLVGAIFLMLSRRSKNSTTRMALLLCAVCMLLEILPNIQPLLGKAIVPYHFTRFYTHTIFHALFLILLAKALSDFRSRSESFISIAISFLTMLLFLYASTGASQMVELVPQKYIYKLHTRNNVLDFRETMKHIANNTPQDSVIAVQAYLFLEYKEEMKGHFISETPIKVKMLTKRKVLFQTWQLDSQYSFDDIERDYLLNWLLTGKRKLSLPCSVKMQKRHDLFSFASDIFRLRRQFKCNLHKDSIEKLNPCELLEKYKVDYLLWNTDNDSAYEDRLSTFSKSQWQASHKTYKLFELDKEKVKQLACSNPLMIRINPKP